MYNALFCVFAIPPPDMMNYFEAEILMHLSATIPVSGGSWATADN
jgi:hypothetical protein